MTSLLQEIISVYPLLNPSQLTAGASNRVCNALALLQCVASHNETRGLFLNGQLSSPKFPSPTATDISNSSHPLVSLSLPQHYLKVTTFRISASHLSGCHWRSRQERLYRCHQLPLDHRDYPTVSSYYGNWLGAQQNCCHFHRPEDSIGRYGSSIHLSHLRKILCCGNSTQQYGWTAGRATGCAASQACSSVLLEVSFFFAGKNHAHIDSD
jgi:hypothetical protein